MRAWQLHEIGEPLDNLQIDEIDDVGLPGEGMVNVAIESVGIAFPDVLMCRGQYQIKTKLPHIPGGESAGRVDTVGEGVTSLSEGDRVAMLGGGLVETVQKPATELFKLPEGFATDKAAAVPINYATTWFALHERAALKAGESLLVTGAAGQYSHRATGAGGCGNAARAVTSAASASAIASSGRATTCRTPRRVV